MVCVFMKVFTNQAYMYTITNNTGADMHKLSGYVIIIDNFR